MNHSHEKAPFGSVTGPVLPEYLPVQALFQVLGVKAQTETLAPSPRDRCFDPFSKSTT